MTETQTIFSFTEWEGSKENILPVKSGRSAGQLSKIFSTKTTEAEKQEMLKQERTTFEKKILQIQMVYIDGINENNTTFNDFENELKQKNRVLEITEEEFNDPLLVWISYCNWAKDNYPNESKEYLKVIERCTSLFKDNRNYANDVRYVRLWMRYADICTSAFDLFNYLEVKDIGQNEALLYETKSIIYEDIGKYGEADDYFKLGINRGVNGLDQLKLSYSQFQIRMQSRVLEFMEKKKSKDSGEKSKSSTSSATSAPAPVKRKPFQVVGGNMHKIAKSNNNVVEKKSSTKSQTSLVIFEDKVEDQKPTKKSSSSSSSKPTSKSSSSSSSSRTSSSSKSSSGSTSSSSKSLSSKSSSRSSSHSSKSLTSSSNSNNNNNNNNNNGSNSEETIASAEKFEVKFGSCWKDFGTEEDRNKENQSVVSSWKGVSLPQKLTQTSESLFEIFEDEEEDEGKEANEVKEITNVDDESEDERIKRMIEEIRMANKSQ